MKIKPIGLILIVSIASFLGACGPTITPAPSVTPTTPATLTPEPSLTSTPSTTPTKTPLPTPTDQANCTDQAEFVEDVTVPDDTLFAPGEKFIKTWRIRNTGTCTWNLRYALVFLKGDQMSAPYSTPLVETPPGEALEISVDMAAPESEGAYQGTYQIENPSGSRFGVKGGNIWIRIKVGGGTPASATPTGTVSSSPVSSLSPTAGTPAGTPTDTATPGPTQPGPSGTCVYTTNPDFDAQVFALINQAREANGLPAFTLNSQLSAAALKHSIDMGCHNLLQHAGSDGSTSKSRIAAEGYNASSSQEAIYAQPPQYGGNPQAAVEWWLNDSFHRPILLSTKLTEIGVGYVNVPSSALGGYFTVDAATP